MTFVLLKVGCLECGEPTTVAGVYDDGGAALAAYEDEVGPGMAQLQSEYAEPEFFLGTATRVGPFGRVQLHEIGET